jgi:hypothetical protein
MSGGNSTSLQSLAVLAASQRPAPGAGELAFLLFGALVMAIPAGIAFGTMFYLAVIALRGEAPPDADERGLPLWGRKLWRRSVRTAVIVVFLALVGLALVSSYVIRR